MPNRITVPHSRDVGGLVRDRARTFYLSSLFLPADIRRDVHLIYAYYRTVDDLVDDPLPGTSRGEVLQALGDWEASLCGAAPPFHPLAAEVVKVVERRRIPPRLLTMVLEGCTIDLDLTWIETRQELLHYCLLMAGSVGMVMAQLLGGREWAALRAARSLGIAMQLTNILRDVGEDLSRGRIYLPREDLMAAGETGDLPELGLSPAVRSVMVDVMSRARELYGEGLAGVEYLEPRSRFAVLLAGSLYARILDKIESRNFDVFNHRAALGTAEKWALTLPIFLGHRRSLRSTCA